MESYLHQAWFIGIRPDHNTMVETKIGLCDPKPVILDMQDDFHDLMKHLSQAPTTTVSSAIQTSNHLTDASIAASINLEAVDPNNLIADPPPPSTDDPPAVDNERPPPAAIRQRDRRNLTELQIPRRRRLVDSPITAHTADHRLNFEA